MEIKALAQELLQEGNGVLRLAPAWVPRSFCRPGRRLKLHPDDYYALGLERGGIDERWFASTTHAENGPETPADEGLSYVVSADGSKKMLLKDMVELLQDITFGMGMILAMTGTVCLLHLISIVCFMKGMGG